MDKLKLLCREIRWLMSCAQSCGEYAWSDDPMAESYKDEGEHYLTTMLIIAQLLREAGYTKASTDVAAAADTIKRG
jgi:hypothetical protein